MFVNGDAEPSHFLLDRGQHGDDGRQRVLVLGHESTDVLDVRARSLVVAGVALHVLQPDVQYPQCPLDRVQLRNGEQLDVRRAAGHRRLSKAAAGAARLRHRRRGSARTDGRRRSDGHAPAKIGSWSEGGSSRRWRCRVWLAY